MAICLIFRLLLLFLFTFRSVLIENVEHRTQTQTPTPTPTTIMIFGWHLLFWLQWLCHDSLWNKNHYHNGYIDIGNGIGMSTSFIYTTSYSTNNTFYDKIANMKQKKRKKKKWKGAISIKIAQSATQMKEKWKRNNANDKGKKPT